MYSVNVSMNNQKPTNSSWTPERLALSQAELESIEEKKRWKPYESANYEQPYLSACCCPIFYQIRWKLLWIFQRRVPFTQISVGTVLFVLIFLLLAIGFGASFSNSKSKSGYLAMTFLALTYTLPTKNSIWLFITGTPFERVLFWHKFIGCITVLLGFYHLALVAKASQSGIILLSLVASLPISAFYKFREKFFNYFQRYHWVAFLLVIPAALNHGAKQVLIGFAFWVLDVLVRIYVIFRNRSKVQEVELTQIEPGLTKICFQNPNFKFKAGQYVFICVPEVSIFEWHPFSLSSSPHEKVVSLHVRALGDWTRKLYQVAGTPKCTTQIWIEGPYGNCKLDIDSEEYKLFMLISGGVGITPLQSICNNLIYEHLRGRDLKKIFFVWSVKDRFFYEAIANNPNSFYNKKLSSNRLPFSFQPDGLVRHEYENILEPFFHLTFVRDEEDFTNANIDPNRQHLLKIGRADLKDYFIRMRTIAKELNETKVAVLCCGPENMMDECGRLAREFSDKEVYFGYHEEVFNL